MSNYIQFLTKAEDCKTAEEARLILEELRRLECNRKIRQHQLECDPNIRQQQFECDPNIRQHQAG